MTHHSMLVRAMIRWHLPAHPCDQLRGPGFTAVPQRQFGHGQVEDQTLNIECPTVGQGGDQRGVSGNGRPSLRVVLHRHWATGPGLVVPVSISCRADAREEQAKPCLTGPGGVRLATGTHEPWRHRYAGVRAYAGQPGSRRGYRFPSATSLRRACCCPTAACSSNARSAAAGSRPSRSRAGPASPSPGWTSGSS